MALSDTKDFEQWITDRIDFTTGTPDSGNTGDMEIWITDRIDLAEYVKVAGAPPAATIMPLIQFANLGADMFDGTLLL